MPVESIGGIRLHVQSLGPTGNGTVVLVHGMTTTLASMYFSIAPALAAEHRVLMYDLRGHGLSEAPRSGYGIRAMAGDLAAVVARHAPEGPLAIVGHSFGAVVALRFTLDHPGRVRKLVFAEGPLPVLLDDLENADGAIELDPTEVVGHIEALRDSAIAHLPAATFEALRGSGRRGRSVRVRASRIVRETTILDDVAQDRDMSDAEIARCDCPVLLCYGTRTLPEMTATCRRLSAVLPDSQVRMFDCGHLMLNQVPGPLAMAVTEFLRRG